MSIISSIRKIGAGQPCDCSRPYGVSGMMPEDVRTSSVGHSLGGTSRTHCRVIADRLGVDWLELLLHRAFDAVKAEPIPAELMQLIAVLDQQ